LKQLHETKTVFLPYSDFPAVGEMLIALKIGFDFLRSEIMTLIA
jgi:hypothetical protein